MNHAPRRAARGRLAQLPIDWGALTPLRLSAQLVADGAYAGMHRSFRRGAGVEFSGHRPYVPGDDLRFLDRRSLMRHDHLMVRQFETDTDRGLWLLLDASASMAFRGGAAPAAKLAYASLLAAALGRVAVSGQDAVAAGWISAEPLALMPPAFGRPGFERLVDRLEAVTAVGSIHEQLRAVSDAVRGIGRRVGRGSIVVVFSDLLDLPPGAAGEIAAMGGRGRALVVVQVLDPCERDLDFRGKVRLRAIEGSAEVVTAAAAVRALYQQRLEAQRSEWRQHLVRVGGRLLTVTSSDDPVRALREILVTVAQVRR